MKKFYRFILFYILPIFINIIYFVNVIFFLSMIVAFFYDWRIAVALMICIGIFEMLRKVLIKPIVIFILREMGMGTLDQIAMNARRSLDDTKEILQKLSEKGSIEIISLSKGVAYKVKGSGISGGNLETNPIEIRID